VAVRGEIIHGEEADFQRICVSDNGPGIPADVLPKLFRPFFTTKARGTGLGLAVVQKIIVQHGGQVEVRNRADGGAEFIVTLPMPRGVPEAVESEQTSI
jgi:signal transduction histidine kinase